MKTFLNIGVIALCSACAQVNAAVIYETHREVIRDDETEHFYERTTLLGKDSRIDFLNKGGSESGSFILSRAHGEEWALNDEGKSTCSAWTREEFFLTMAKAVEKAKKLAKVNISSIDQVKIQEEVGEEILGMPTVHVTLKSNYTAEGRFLFLKITYAIEETDEMWMTSDWEWPQHEWDWLEAGTRTGNAFLDEHESKWLSHVQGPILKHTNTVTLTNVKNGKAESKTEHFTVTDLREIPDSELDPALFSWPACKTVTAKEMEHQATRMLKKYFK